MALVRTRFAPSPTGHLHIGGLRTALYNFLFVRHHKGQFIVRIEDTDRTRIVPGTQEEILDILKRAGFTYDEGPDVGGKYGPYVQSERLDIYRKHAEELAEKGAAYWCTCSAERLEKMREEQKKRGEVPKYDGHCRNKDAGSSVQGVAVLRLKVPVGRTITFTDTIRGNVSFASNDVDDQVLLKSDGFPTYHLANIVDDHLMKITHVIRGEEWLSSTPKHILLYEAFGWKPPEFAHLPLILSGEGGKLSKRSGHASAMEYFEQGYLPEAIINFLALLGWNPRADQEVYTLKELIAAFDLSKVNKGGAVFSMDKLQWIAREHMKRADAKELAKAAEEFLEKKGLKGDEKWLVKIMAVEQQRIATLSEAGEETRFAFDADIRYDAKLLVAKKSSATEAKDRLRKVNDFLEKLKEKDFEIAVLQEKVLAWIAKEDLGNSQTLWPLRVALTGREKSPSPFEAAALLGRERTLKRIAEALNRLK